MSSNTIIITLTEKCDNNINCFDNKENIVVMKEEEFDGSTTHCTELSIASIY